MRKKKFVAVVLIAHEIDFGTFGDYCQQDPTHYSRWKWARLPVQLASELAAEYAKLEAIFKASPDILVLKDNDSVYQRVNPTFRSFIGREDHDIVGRTDQDLFPEKTHDIIWQAMPRWCKPAFGRMKNKTRLFLVDDHPAMRHGIAQLAANENDLEVCNEAGDRSETLDTIAADPPDFIVLDVALKDPDRKGLDLISEIHACIGPVPILICSIFHPVGGHSRSQAGPRRCGRQSRRGR